MVLCAPAGSCGCAISSTTLSISGSGTAANPWAIEAFVGVVSPYTPTLEASSDPSLGSTGQANGQYSRQGDFVFYEFAFLFDGTGISQGSGTYRISMPFAAAHVTGAGMAPRGLAMVLDGGTLNVRNFVLVLTQVPDELNMRPLNAASYASAPLVSHANIGTTFQADTAITGQIVYHAA